jgi:nucleoside-diphosphate-sugar epimerase
VCAAAFGSTSRRACSSAANVDRLVHVSSPSVAHAGDALVGVGAGPADPDAARGHYARSKAIAEQEVLAAAVPAVVVVRPHLVWGPGDTQLVGRIVARARAGRLAVVGTGAALIDTTYVDDAVDALVAALDRAPDLHRRVLVVSGGEPRPVAELLASICTAVGAPAPRIAVPSRLARAAGAVVETLWRHDPPMTRFLAEQLSTAHWFDQRETRSALGWSPRVGLDEGFRRLRTAGS